MKTLIACKLLLILFVFPGFCPQATFAQQSPAKFLFEGSIHGAADGSKVELYDLDQQVVLDSTYIRAERFVLKGHVDQPTTCWLRCLNEYAIVQVENVPIRFESPLKSMHLGYTASGGREQARQTQLNDLQRPYDRVYFSAYDSLTHKLYANDAGKKRLIDVFNEAQSTSMEIYVDFGKTNINSYLGLSIIYMNRKTLPRDSVIHLYDALQETYKNSANGKALKIFLYEPLAEKDKPMIDFEARTMAGKPFRLSSLKGQYIYLSFGSAGCGPCRMETKEISRNYDRLSKLMHFVYFSLDKNKDYWKTATREDRIVWDNVSDRDGEFGRIKTIYNVQSMPTSFLINQKGVILKKIEWYDTETLTEIEKMIRGER